MPQRICSDCNEEKDEVTCFERMPTGKFRNQCKQCKTARRKKSANSDAAKKLKLENRLKVLPPRECTECHKGPSEVKFTWREDTKTGGWRTVCNTCTLGKGYYTAYRERKHDEDSDAFKAHNARVHLEWAHRNPGLVKAQHDMERTDPDRKFKGMLTYVKHKNEPHRVKDNVNDQVDEDDIDVSEMPPLHINVMLEDEVKLKAKFALPCHYCGHAPRQGEALNSLDRIDPSGPYSEANTVAACVGCNKMKGCTTADEFLDNVRRIIHHTGVDIP